MNSGTNDSQAQGCLAGVPVELGERRYTIGIGADWLPALVAQMAGVFSPRPVVLVTSDDIARHWEAPVTKALAAAGYEVDVCRIPSGEPHKNLQTVARILDHMIGRRFSRQAGLI